MLTADQIAQFHRDGFLLGPRILKDRDIQILNENVLHVIENRNHPRSPQPLLLRNLASDHAPVWQIVNIHEVTPGFGWLVGNRTIAQHLSQLIPAHPIRLFHDQIQYKPAATGGVNMWHQDLPYWPILKGGTQVTAWIALDDADEENGCMSMVPGSHRWGDQISFLESVAHFDAMPREFQGHPLQVKPCPVPAGHVHYHHSLTWHGSPANTSGRPRRAVALHFISADTLYNAAGNHPLKAHVTSLDGEAITGETFPLIRPPSPSPSGRGPG